MKLRCFTNTELNYNSLTLRPFFVRYDAAWATKRLNTGVVRYVMCIVRYLKIIRLR